MAILLSRLGVQKVDGFHFFEQNVLPILIGPHILQDSSGNDFPLREDVPPEIDKLVACTYYLKKMLSDNGLLKT